MSKKPQLPSHRSVQKRAQMPRHVVARRASRNKIEVTVCVDKLQPARRKMKKIARELLKVLSGWTQDGNPNAEIQLIVFQEGVADECLAAARCVIRFLDRRMRFSKHDVRSLSESLKHTAGGLDVILPVREPRNKKKCHTIGFWAFLDKEGNDGSDAIPRFVVKQMNDESEYEL